MHAVQDAGAADRQGRRMPPFRQILARCFDSDELDVTVIEKTGEDAGGVASAAVCEDEELSDFVIAVNALGLPPSGEVVGGSRGYYWF